MRRDKTRLFIEHSPKEMLVISARLLMTMSLIALANLAIFWLFVLRGQMSSIFGYFPLTLLYVAMFCLIVIYLYFKSKNILFKESDYLENPWNIDNVNHYKKENKNINGSIKNVPPSISQRNDHSGVVILTELAKDLLSQRESQAVENIEVFVTYNYEVKDNSKTELESFLRPVDLTEITVYEVIP